MKKNMGTVDRTLRVLAAIVIGVLLFTGTLEGTLAIVLGIAAVLLLLTSLMATCPAYFPLNLSTRKGD